MLNFKTEDMALLVEKWDNKGFELKKLGSDLAKTNMAILLENQHNYLNEAGSTMTGDIANFNRVLMPLVRRIFPNLIANEIVGVQPMTGPVGLAYAMRFRRGDNNGELGYNTVDKTFTGSYATSAGETLESTVPTSTGNWARGKMTLEQVMVKAETRKMKTSYSLEAAQDLKAMHGVDLEANMIEALQYEIAQEIDRELMDRINTLADTYAITYTVSAGDGQWEAEKFRNLYTRLVKEATSIATRTRRGAGNFIVCSDNVVTALDSLGQFLLQPVDNATMEIAPGIAKVGTIGNRFNVYRDTFASADYATVGYKGPGSQNSGVIYCPYVPLLLMRATEPGSLAPVLGVQSRYGIVDHLLSAEEFYAKVNVDFTNVF